MLGSQALIVETELPEKRRYWNFQLNDPYFNAVEYVYRLSSTNGHFAHVASDGRFYAVIAQEDPGAPNWLDAAGFYQGTRTAAAQEHHAKFPDATGLAPLS